MFLTDEVPQSADQPLVLSPISRPAAIETLGVLHVINGEHYAGAERVQDLLAKCLPELGFRVGLACLKLDAFDAMRQSQDAAAIRRADARRGSTCRQPRR